MLMELRAAKAQLEFVEPILIGAGKTSTARWFELVSDRPDLARSLKARTRANFIHDHFCTEIDQGVAELSGVHATEAGGFFTLIVGTEILLRPKYLGQGVPSNVATVVQKELAKQEFNEDLLEALGLSAPPTLLTSGYTLGDGQLGHIEIRRECKGTQPWKYEIYGGEATAEPLTFQGLGDQTKPAKVKSNRTKEAEKGQELAGEA
jgi:hypothetical protein